MDLLLCAESVAVPPRDSVPKADRTCMRLHRVAIYEDDATLRSHGSRCSFAQVNEMMLSTHALIGAAIGAFLSSDPALGAALGFCSHFVLDAIPHWDYPIRSASLTPGGGSAVRLDRNLLVDLFIIGADGLIGLAAAMFLFGFQWGTLFGAVGAMLPDPLQLLHDRFPHEPLCTLRRFRRRMHSRKTMALFPFGMASQLALIAFAGLVTKLGHGGAVPNLPMSWAGGG